MQKYLVLALWVFVLGIFFPDCVNAEVAQLGMINSGDATFKLALAKVVFFLSILGIGAGLIKKYRSKSLGIVKDVVKLKHLQEFHVGGQVKLSLLEIEGKKVIVASNSNGGLALLELSLSRDLIREKEASVELVSKNVSNA